MATICILTTAHHLYDDRIFYREAVSLASSGGHEVLLIAPGNETETMNHGVHIRTIQMPRNRFERFTVTVLRLMKEAFRTKADIYHFHDPDLLPWMALFALSGRKVVYDVHEYYGYSLQNAEWLPSMLRKPVAAAVDWLEKLVNRTFAGTITVNPHMEQLFSETSRNTVTVSNYPLQWFIEQTKPAEAAQERDTIIYMGNLNKMRGYKMILDTMKIVHAKHPEFFCHIIGWMDYTGIDASIPRLNTRETDSMGIRYTPPVGVMEMPRFLKQASVCWLPWQRSMNHEFGTPIKLFEYMATGRPVVCSRMGIISTVVNETGCGLLVQPDDPQAHAEALIYLLTHPEEAAQMGACGREWVVARYNWSVEEKKLLAFYDQLSRQNGVTEREGVVYDHGR